MLPTATPSGRSSLSLPCPTAVTPIHSHPHFYPRPKRFVHQVSGLGGRITVAIAGAMELAGNRTAIVAPIKDQECTTSLSRRPRGAICTLSSATGQRDLYITSLGGLLGGYRCCDEDRPALRWPFLNRKIERERECRRWLRNCAYYQRPGGSRVNRTHSQGELMAAISSAARPRDLYIISLRRSPWLVARAK